MARIKLGFIDYYIDEWHSANYPKFFANCALADQVEIALAYETVSLPGKKPLKQWCEEFKVGMATSMEHIVSACDALLVLAPGDPEQHEKLADAALRSGKPVYVDKTFTTTLASAKRMFDLARKHNTPMFTCSALRFGKELVQFIDGDLKAGKAHFVATHGPGRTFEEYIVHQVETIPPVLGVGARRVLYAGSPQVDAVVIDYGDGRRATLRRAMGLPYGLDVHYGENKVHHIRSATDFFDVLMTEMIKFFQTRKPPVAEAHTLEIIAIYEALIAAKKTPDQWVAVPTA